MKSHLAAYDPDLIIVLTVPNDITTSNGVNGEGQITGSFSPEDRKWGSALFTNQAGVEFGDYGYTVLTTDLCETCKDYWKKGVGALKDLINLQKARNKRILLSVNGTTLPSFVTYYESAIFKAKVAAPVLVTDYFGERLPHDDHPSRKGHGILAAQYINAISALGWASIPKNELPMLRESLNLKLETNLEQAVLEKIRKDDIARLPELIDFKDIGTSGGFPLLGGFFKDEHSYPWASIRSGFVLATQDKKKNRFKMEILLPSVQGLYPMTIALEINGQRAWEKRYEFVPTSVKEDIIVSVVKESNKNALMEFVLFADRHFETFTSEVMRAFQVVSAEMVTNEIIAREDVVL